jgi:hypothetical protein
MAKDETEIGITGLPIPKKKRSPAKQHEFEKERRKNMGTNVGGEKYKKDVTSGYSRRSMREEVLSYLLDEGFASDEKSAKAILGAMSEAWVESIVENRGMSHSGGKPGASGDGGKPTGITGGTTYKMKGWDDDKDPKKSKVKDV